MNYKSFNHKSLMEQFSSDEKILLEMIDIFESNWTQLLGTIRISVEEKNGDELRIQAHTFKGIMGNFFDEEGKLIAKELESRGEKKNFDDSYLLLNKLENHLMVFLYEINTLKFILKKSF